MKYTTILFDLDGTVSDTKPGIMNSVQYSLNALGIEVPPFDTLERFIGPPLRQSFRECFGFDDALTEIAVRKYREYYGETGLYENFLYPGMECLLKKLHGEGRALAIATTKAAVYAERILERLGIARYFAFIAGSELDGSRSDKAELIRYAMENLVCGGNGDKIITCGVGNAIHGRENDGGDNTINGRGNDSGDNAINGRDGGGYKIDARSAVMIGDRAFDIIGAKACGIDSIGVLFGYGELEELTGAGADYIAARPDDLYDLL